MNSIRKDNVSLVSAFAAIAVVLLVIPLPALAQSETALYNFTGHSDGYYPNGALTADSSGNLYGTTVYGGQNDEGTVFELSPAPVSGCASGTNPGNGWCETAIYSFCSAANCTDGENPNFTYVTFDHAGNLYGTTLYGGSNTYGTVFELSPEPITGCSGGTNPGIGWCETVLYSFRNQNDGAYPQSGLVWDTLGNLYGTSSDWLGVQASVYELSSNGSGGWNEQVIYVVSLLNTGLAIDAANNLYGADVDQHVFKLSFVNGAWDATNIHTFTGSPDGLWPNTPTVDSAGNVYGTTSQGGTENYGTIWKLIPEIKQGVTTYKEKILGSFPSAGVGGPATGVVLDSSGDIYGTTGSGKYEDGEVFELAVSGASYKGKLLWNFNYTDGDDPEASLLLGNSGHLYGTTVEGGTQFEGTVFEVNLAGVASKTTLTSSPNPSTSGETVTFTATVTSSKGAPPDGETVSFIGDTLLGTGSLSGGVATFTTSSLPVGSSNISATYSGDANFGASTSNTVKQVVQE